MFRAIGRFLKKVFTGKAATFAEEWGVTITQIVGILFFADNLNGATKFATIISALKNMVIQQGKEYVDYAANLLIELQYAQKMGDNVEQIYEEGITAARDAIAKVDVNALLSGDKTQQDKAIAELKANLTAAGKLTLADIGRNLNLLIAFAVAELQK
jgi:hypothetical protein